MPSNKSDDPRKIPPKPAGEVQGPKKPSALLDLKATEITAPGSNKPGTPAASAGRSSAAGTPASPQAGKAEPKQSVTPPSGTGPGASSAQLQGKPASATAGASSAPPQKEEPAASGSGQSPTGKDSASKDTAGKRAASPPGGAPKATAGTTAAKEARGGSRVVSHAAAGLAGGALALALMSAGAVVLGWLPPQQTYPANVVDDLRRRVAVLEKRAAERPNDQAAELGRRFADLEGRMARVDEVGSRLNEVADAQAKLDGRTRALEERIAQVQGASELGDRLGRLEQTIATLSAAAASDPQPGRIPQLAALSGKLNDLETTLNNQLTALRKSVAQEVESRSAAAQEASEAARSAAQRIDREMSAIKAEMARLAQRSEALKAADDTFQQGLRALQEETAGARSALDSLRNDLTAQLRGVTRPQDVNAALAPLADKIAAMERNVEGVLKNEEERKANAERVVLALEIGNLKRAVARGAKYSHELAAVKQMAGGAIDLSPLERYKDQGISTQSDLARDFRTVANAMLDSETAPADGSTLDRLLQGARSIVRVRRTDHRPDDMRAEAIVARMEKALGDDRLADVLAEASRLSPQARAAAEEWLARVEARVAADRALARIEEQLKASMSGKPQSEKRT